MMRRRSVVVLRPCLLLICALLLMSCSRFRHVQAEPLKSPAKVGVFVADYSGSTLWNTNEPGSTFARAHLYEAFWKAGFSTVAHNDLHVAELLGSQIPDFASCDKGGEQANGCASSSGDKARLFSSMQDHFRALGLDYVAVVFVKTYNIADYLEKVVFIEVETMEVVAVDIKKRRTITAVCSSTWWLGVPMLVCPFLAIHDSEAREVKVMSEALGRLQRLGVGQAPPKMAPAPPVENESAPETVFEGVEPFSEEEPPPPAE